ncbi:alpha/beta hydrolase [Jongsikchunia kroppenstedtii]|uniref:alpha/beta hydrolase n=1 Tax=Jongsikchunia kroppenstedtii TaxID=1121721 RepID=UPI00037DA7AD|nr:alpha/beta hydrolase [Jongsikchunia kroppenstedtii]
MSIIAHRTPSLRSFPLWLAARAFLKPTLTYWPLSDLGLSPLRLIDQAFTLLPTADTVVRQSITLAERPADLITPQGPSGRDTDTAVLYLHGGAFVVAGPATHRSVGAALAQVLGLPLYSLDYRQLPKAGVGTSVADAVNAYRELIVDRGFRRVVLAGDSAGGYLCGKVIEAAYRDGLPTPAAYVGFSPLLDLDLADNETRDSDKDAYIPKVKLAKLAPKYDRGPAELRGERRILDVPAEAFPPTILITAQDEYLEPDAIDLVESLSNAGVMAHLHTFAWQVHAFPVVAGMPESKEAIRLSADFARAALATGRAAVVDSGSVAG